MTEEQLDSMQKNLQVTVADLKSVTNLESTLKALNKKDLVLDEDLNYIAELKNKLEQLFLK